ncbi:SDR family NAD(P)-dependent oxidoreductase [Microbacterium sp. Root180]|uniref:SDR family NAD(P)-dependent oxidoreductase n=1 Tax=Microbacterium sp. Root180 TaxID=1736483 RepID=UPI000701980F|nr:SDR family oxidoreductase [Microbacterium sp. Root180]KRB39135.1 alcohol dehydrogenase [Microbacterium sp. Root180]
MPDDVSSRFTRERDHTQSLAGRLVVIAGATSASGLAATRTLVSAGARVVAVGRDAARLGPLEAAGARTDVCDLTDEDAVAGLAERLHATGSAVDGVLHLVGGWRGGGGLAGQSDADFRFLEGSLTALRHVSRAFDADLRASSAGRLAVVSSTAVARPLAGGANYAAVKAATEAWARAVAQGFAKSARDAGQPLAAASVVFRVKSLDGLEDALAQRFADLWAVDAAEVNDTVVELTAPSL